MAPPAAAVLSLALCATLSVGVVLGQDGPSSGRCLYHKVLKRVECADIVSEIEFHQALQVEGAPKADELFIANSSFRFFHHDVFEGKTFKMLAIINCSLLGLTDTQTAFRGLENRLETLVVKNTSFVGGWNWDHLRNLTTLKNVTVVDSDLEVVGEAWRNISGQRMERLEISGCGVAWIADRAFAHFTRLIYVLLKNNRIRILKRTMFPDNMLGMHLGNNLITRLPPDMFDNMPKLKNIVLTGNFISTIDSNVFSRVWRQIWLLELIGNPMICDCRLTWITKQRPKPRLVLAVCAMPADLRGRFVTKVAASSLWC